MIQKKQIILDFGSIVLEAELFNTSVADSFAGKLPYRINLEKWGNELYGSIGIDLGEEKPVPDIPSGGIAYTNRGNYFCIFFGQRPAWQVEHIGQINNNGWEKLVGNISCNAVTIRLKQ
ncbi:MAG: cyclophilin-like fold protein [Spirochaetota bacterium]